MDVIDILVEEFKAITGFPFPEQSSVSLSNTKLNILANGKSHEIYLVSRGGYAPYRIEDLAVLIVEFGLKEITFLNDTSQLEWEAVKNYLISVISEAANNRLRERYPQVSAYQLMEEPKVYELMAPFHIGGSTSWTALLVK